MRAPKRHARQGTLGAALLFITACGDPGSGAAPSLTVERDTIADTVVVRTLAGSVWGDSVQLVEELRIGQLDDDDDAYTFGQVREMAVSSDGTIYVYDGAVRALRAYDSTGRYLRTIGAEGAGPGEYREIVGLVVDRNGRLLLRDPRLGRVMVYSATGEPVSSWPMPSGLYTSDALRADTTGHVYARIRTGEVEPGRPWPMGFVRLAADGRVVDTLPAPTWAEARASTAVYDPVVKWTWHPHGYFVAAFGARYAVDLRRPAGPVLRIERAAQPQIPVPAGERAELDSIFAALRRQQPAGGGEAPTPVPAVKPFIRELATGADGRIWVRPHLPSVERTDPVDTTLPVEQRPRRWTEPTAWDVFDPDGTYLGRVPLPPRTTLYAMRGENAWGTVRDENDVPYLVRWRIVPAVRASASH